MNSGGDRRARIISRLTRNGSPISEAEQLCQVAVSVTELSGAGVMLMSGDIARGSVCSSNAVSNVIEQLQYTLGEGPCVDAYEYDHPILEPDLAHPVAMRWLAFSPPAIDAGARAVFGFPLQVGAVRLGALNLYREKPGSLTSNQHADALVLADVVAQAILVLQANAPPGTVAAELETGSDFHYAVHQASGMVAVQLDLTVIQALVRMRAYAFRRDLLVSDVARLVIDRTLRFDTRGDGEDSREP